jgi:hypothetical protein
MNHYSLPPMNITNFFVRERKSFYSALLEKNFIIFAIEGRKVSSKIIELNDLRFKTFKTWHELGVFLPKIKNHLHF